MYMNPGTPPGPSTLWSKHPKHSQITQKYGTASSARPRHLKVTYFINTVSRITHRTICFTAHNVIFLEDSGNNNVRFKMATISLLWDAVTFDNCLQIKTKLNTVKSWTRIQPWKFRSYTDNAHPLHANFEECETVSQVWNAPSTRNVNNCVLSILSGISIDRFSRYVAIANWYPQTHTHTHTRTQAHTNPVSRRWSKTSPK